MGLLDFLLSKQQKREKLATELGIESGLFVRCPICKDVTEAPDPSLQRASAESLVRKLLEQKDPRLSLFDGDEKEIIRTLAQVGRDLPYRCNCHNI